MKRLDTLVWVEILEAKPNKMFTENQRRAVRFLRYSRKVPCVECGKKIKVAWTMLCEFEAHTMGASAFNDSGKVHPPLTPVCGDHPLSPPIKRSKRK